MINSIRRKTLAAALAIALPPALAVYSYAGPKGIWVALLATLPGILAALFLGTGLSRKLQRCTAFVNSIPDPTSPRSHLSFGGEDELGTLTHALNSAGPKVREIVQGLTMELARYEAIVSGLTEGVLVVDSKLTITFCNRAFVEAIGDHGVAKGLPLIKVIREPALLEALKAVVDSGTEVRKRLELSVQDGRIFEIHAAPLAGAPSRSAVAILHDLTPRERLDRIRRDFIANVSHEFRTPLATIRGFAETLLDGGLEDRQNRRKFVEVIYANSVRLNNIASDLLSLSESGSRFTILLPRLLANSAVG
jgi:two-component system phosphate regulon sensor histidine kinase PhoR